MTGLGDDVGDIGGDCHGCSGPQDPAVYINQTKSNFYLALFFVFALLPCLETTHFFVQFIWWFPLCMNSLCCSSLILISPNPVRHQQIYKLIIDTYISFSDSPMNSLSWSLSSEASKKFPRLGFKQGGRQWACRSQVCLRFEFHFTSYVWYRSEEISPLGFRQMRQTTSLQASRHLAHYIHHIIILNKGVRQWACRFKRTSNELTSLEASWKFFGTPCKSFLRKARIWSWQLLFHTILETSVGSLSLNLWMTASSY